MASRQVTLLTRGYLTGRLDFNYPHPHSYLREAFIVGEIEKELISELLRLRAQVDASLLSIAASKSKEAYDAPQAVVKTYSEIVLPYYFKPAKIDKQSLEALDLDAWGAVLRERRDTIKQEKERKQNPATEKRRKRKKNNK